MYFRPLRNSGYKRSIGGNMADAAERFFYEGKRAFFQVKSVTTNRGSFFHVTDNPYTPNSFRGKEWQRGYNVAYFENKERADSGKLRTHRKKQKKV